MKKAMMALVAVAGVVLMAGCCAVGGRCGKGGCAGGVCRSDGPPPRVLRHVVLFQWNEGTPEETIRDIEQAFCALPDKIDTICGFEWGTDVSVESKTDGFTHAFLVTFKSEEDRATYLPHPAHQAFVALAKPHMAKVLVLDYWKTRGCGSGGCR